MHGLPIIIIISTLTISFAVEAFRKPYLLLGKACIKHSSQNVHVMALTETATTKMCVIFWAWRTQSVSPDMDNSYIVTGRVTMNTTFDRVSSVFSG